MVMDILVPYEDLNSKRYSLGAGVFNLLFLGLHIDIIPSSMMRLHTLILIYLSMQPLVEFSKDRKTDGSPLQLKCGWMLSIFCLKLRCGPLPWARIKFNPHFHVYDQQHGSVFRTNCRAPSGLKPSQSLASQLFPWAFCLHNSPTWQDSSTTAAGKRLEDVVGGPQALADLTGCRTCE